ncbi:serine hydrolase domain-containing protein [Streptomyces spirodelae]|uniref:Beta-lactamase family protein n=1 Tax=Streptomyces spirodelae TaxID=2812904 RepID=A0ABS3WTA9_9ACTN|nr:serine hydrolase domain-containing protein [Streptomyces spirodelae]MBO8186353.1 beta-lactamase family protein [Streptomyces spirodelae]
MPTPFPRPPFHLRPTPPPPSGPKPLHLRTTAVGVTLLLLALLTAIPQTAAAQPAQADRPAAHATYDELDNFVRTRMTATNTPGLSYAVVGPDGPLHQRSWGTDGNGRRVTAKTPFLWGSVAKPATATAVMTLIQSGRLRLDDRVVDHLPSFRFGGTKHASQVTVRHLLNQTAGLPEAKTSKITDCFGTHCPDPARRIADLKGIKPLGPPGARYQYASANYLVLTALVEAVTERPYAQYLRRAVLQPAGMKDAVTDAASARERALPPGHQLLWGIPAAIADGIDDDGAGYGYLGGDLHDLAAFASFQLRAGKTTDGKAVLTPESVRLMREEGTLRPSGNRTGYGLGWRIGGLDAPLGKAIWHTGATPGYSAMLFLLPEQNTALVVQQNLHGILHDPAVMEVGFGAARILAGSEPAEAATALPYHTAVWTTTGSALLLLAATIRSLALLRRQRVYSSRTRLAVMTTAWCAAGALPGIALFALARSMSARQLLNWVPDSFLALCAAATAGALTVFVRLTLALRDIVRGRAERGPDAIAE